MTSGTQLSGQATRDSSPAFARSIAIVCRNLAQEVSPLLSLGRFDLVRTLGSGGNGVVYEAFDRQQHERVALKILQGRGPSYLYRLKREFRTLAQLRHPSLVALHELFVEGADAYFTMELIDGSDFLSYVHDAARSGVRGLAAARDALLQLCEGVHALHRAGTLHRDLKPSNVLVNAAGRVVLLDFGLAGDARRGALGREGTPGYMAPEQALGAACEGSDWYSFGCMLRRTLDVLAPARAANDVRELHALADQLTSADPAARPAYPEIMAAFQRASAPPPPPVPVIEPANAEAHTAQLAKLMAAFERSHTEPLVIVARGDSGSGKSVLLQRFADQLESASKRRPVLVLHGRCYERESLPYKGIDSAVDELSRVLIALPTDHAARESLPDCAALVALFPVLGRVPWLQAADSAQLTGLHPLEARARGFGALRTLLARLAIDRALVLCIDDMQWSDADSGRLLGALLCEETSPAMLVVVADRPAHTAMRTALDELESVAELAPRPVCVEVMELAAADAAPPIEAALEQQLRELPAASLAILELASAAGRPLPARLIADAARLGVEHHAHIKTLRAAGLLRAVLRGDDEWLELAHERVAEHALERIGKLGRSERHLRLIEVLKAQPSTTSEVLIDQYVGAGEHAQAASCAHAAADAAFAALAFARASRLYERALALGFFAPAQRAQIHAQHAVALAHAGRGIESADAYRAAASLTADPHEAAPFQQRAADQLMRNGRYREGEASLRRVYRTLGLHWPQNGLAVALGIARSLLPAAVRRLASRLRQVSPELRRLRAELIAAATAGLEIYDPLRAIHNALLCFEEAEQLSDLRWQIRVHGSRGIMRSLAFSRDTVGLRELESACAAAAQLGDPAARGEVELQRAVGLYMRGRSKEALEAASLSEANLRLVPGDDPARLHTARALIASALLDLGRLREARRHWHTLTHAARLHGDLMTIVWVHTHPVQLAALFATEEQARSRAVLERAGELRAANPRYLLLSWAHATCRVAHASYWGAPHEALAIWRSEESVLLGTPFWALRSKAQVVRARAYLLAASALPVGRQRAALLRRVRLDAALLLLRTSPYDRGMARLLAAGAASLRKDTQRALSHLDAARELFDAGGACLLSAAARCCTGALIGGEEGAQLQEPALAAFADEGVVDPRRYIAWLAPGFRELILTAEGSDR